MLKPIAPLSPIAGTARQIILWVALVLFATTTTSNASGKIGYGSRAGMTVSVVSMSGLDTARAVIHTKHTQEDAESYCREYVLKVTPECIRSELEIPLNDVIAANCNSGEFIDFRGNHFRFLGPNPNKNGMVEYVIKNVSTGDVADGSSASGYPVNIEIFKALCPLTVIRAR